MLQMDPHATPDDIKCRLMSTANAGFGSEATTSPFLKGSGLVDSFKAANSKATGCANSGLDIEADLDGIAHFTGPAGVDEDGEFYIGLSSGAVLSESTGWGVSNEATGWGVSNEATGWGVSNEATAWGVFNEATGWGVSNEATGWGVLAESTGWGVSAESTGWGVSAESTGWGVSTESLSDGTGTTSTSTDNGEDFVWDETIEETVVELEEGI
jgi:serine protease AprX